MTDEQNLTERDKTRFLERGFTVVENTRHSLRLIKRDDARQAISIKWDDLSALRELITLALNDGPMVIGRDVSGQNAENAATSMRSACIEKVKELGQQWYAEAKKRGAAFSDKGRLAETIAKELESVTIQEQKS